MNKNEEKLLLEVLMYSLAKLDLTLEQEKVTKKVINFLSKNY